MTPLKGVQFNRGGGGFKRDTSSGGGGGGGVSDRKDEKNTDKHTQRHKPPLHANKQCGRFPKKT